METPTKKYWVESSFTHNDTDKEFPEHLIVAVDMGDETMDIASFPLELKEDIEELVEHFNKA